MKPGDQVVGHTYYNRPVWGILQVITKDEFVIDNDDGETLFIPHEDIRSGKARLKIPRTALPKDPVRQPRRCRLIGLGNSPTP